MSVEAATPGRSLRAREWRKEGGEKRGTAEREEGVGKEEAIWIMDEPGRSRFKGGERIVLQRCKRKKADREGGKRERKMSEGTKRGEARH